MWHRGLASTTLNTGLVISSETQITKKKKNTMTSHPSTVGFRFFCVLNFVGIGGKGVERNFTPIYQSVLSNILGTVEFQLSGLVGTSNLPVMQKKNPDNWIFL
jgi:hypothetical protein